MLPYVSVVPHVSVLGCNLDFVCKSLLEWLLTVQVLPPISESPAISQTGESMSDALSARHSLSLRGTSPRAVLIAQDGIQPTDASELPALPGADHAAHDVHAGTEMSLTAGDHSNVQNSHQDLTAYVGSGRRNSKAFCGPWDGGESACTADREAPTDNALGVDARGLIANAPGKDDIIAHGDHKQEPLKGDLHSQRLSVLEHADDKTASSAHPNSDKAADSRASSSVTPASVRLDSPGTSLNSHGQKGTSIAVPNSCNSMESADGLHWSLVGGRQIGQVQPLGQSGCQGLGDSCSSDGHPSVSTTQCPTRHVADLAVMDMLLEHRVPCEKGIEAATACDAAAGVDGHTPGLADSSAGKQPDIPAVLVQGQRNTSEEAHWQTARGVPAAAVSGGTSDVSDRASFEHHSSWGLTDCGDLDMGMGALMDIMPSIVEESEVNIVGIKGQYTLDNQNDITQAGMVHVAPRQIRAWSGRPATPLLHPQHLGVPDHEWTGELSHSTLMQDVGGDFGSHSLDQSENGGLHAMEGPEFWQNGQVVLLEPRHKVTDNCAICIEPAYGHTDPTVPPSIAKQAAADCGRSLDPTVTESSPETTTHDAYNVPMMSSTSAGPLDMQDGSDVTASVVSATHGAGARDDVRKKNSLSAGGAMSGQDPNILATLLGTLPGGTSSGNGNLDVDLYATGTSAQELSNTGQVQRGGGCLDNFAGMQVGVQPQHPLEQAAETLGCASC
jgi:hypothetical protein